MSGICKVNFPLYCCHCISDDALVIAGGGGAAKTGVRNCVEIVELKKVKKKVVAEPISQLDTGKHAVMSMAVLRSNSGSKTTNSEQDKSLLALSLGNKCCIYSMKKTKESNQPEEAPSGLTKRKKGSQPEKGKGNTQNQGISNYKFELIHEIDAVPSKGGLQTSVQLSRNGDLIVSGGSDGHLRAWKLPSKELVFTCEGHKDDITDIDISPDSKQVTSVSRDGKAFIWDASMGHKILELHSTWNMQMITRSYRFRNCRFGIVLERPSVFPLFTTHTPTKQDPKKKPNYCCITKWAKRRNKEGNESGELIPAIVQTTGKDAISSMSVSRNGVFVAVGFMEGSVAIYIAFSLQCAHKIRNVHNIFVTSLSFLNDTEHTRAITGDCDAAVVSVSADCTCHLSKLGSRTLFSLWLVVFLCIIVLAAVAFYLHSVGFFEVL